MNQRITLPPVASLSTGADSRCTFCRGSTCCTYLTQQIDAPRSMADFDLLLWQISHANVQVYQDDIGWFLLVNNRCMHLADDGRCQIYHERPQVCRDHSDTDCEFDGPCGPEDFKLFFQDYDALLAYCRQRFKRWDQRFEE